jgi:nucleotide-binding universal stress UspA family protein
MRCTPHVWKPPSHRSIPARVRRRCCNSQVRGLSNDRTLHVMLILKRILVATDLSAAAHRAVMRAGQLASQWGADLFLVRARPNWNLFARGRGTFSEGYQDIAQSADNPLRAVLADLEASFGVHARYDFRLGRTSNVIAAMVAEHDPHLVVIGVRGEHDTGEIGPCLGGTALELLTRLEQPLLLVGGATAAAYTTSLVALDAVSALSQRAVLWGTGLVQGGDCHVLHAYDMPYVESLRPCGVTNAMIEGQRYMRQAYEDAITSVQEALCAAEGAARLHRHAVRGEPVAMMLAEITLHAPQLVVIGKPDPHSPHVQRRMMNGVGFRIAYHAPVDVLIIS